MNTWLRSNIRKLLITMREFWELFALKWVSWKRNITNRSTIMIVSSGGAARKREVPAIAAATGTSLTRWR
jgi:hypothetical protein